MDKSPNRPTSGVVMPHSDPTKPLWTVADVAVYLRLHPETVRMMARSGKIPSIKVGKTWRFYSDQIKTWLARNGIKKIDSHNQNSMQE